MAGDGAAARPLAFAVPRARLRLDGGEFGERADAADVVKAAGVAAVYGPGTNIPEAAGEVLEIVRERSAA